MAAIRSTGLGSNLDVETIIKQLMDAERLSLRQLDSREAGYQVKISALATLKSALGGFQTAAAKLKDPAKFEALSAVSSNADFLTATVTDRSAAPATNNIEVLDLARSQKLASSGFAASTTTIGTGTLEFEFGAYDSGSNTFTSNSARAVRTVTIDPAHATLGGIRDAVNAAKIGVTASIVNDGSGNRLVFSSDETGAQNGLKISVTDADTTHTDNAGLSQLAYDPTAAVGAGKNIGETVSALDARVVIDGITVIKPKNTITDAIAGVSLNLVAKTTGTPVKLTVSKDLAAVKGAINDFVKSYNDFANTLKQVSGYDAATKTASPLLGDAVPRAIESQLRSIITSRFEGATYESLAQIGVAFTKEGTLAINSEKLDAALAADPGNVAGLFAARGTATDLEISHSSSTAATQAGSYGVSITQLATRGVATGVAAAGLVITAGVNDTLALKVDGIDVTVQLTARTYASAAQLALEVEAQLDAKSELVAAASSVSVSESAGVLSITSDRYGSASSVEITGGNGRSNLFGASTTETDGVDVEGTIGGVTARGSGQKLTGAAGSAAEGLAIIVSGGALGMRGSVVFSRGAADRLEGLLAQITGTSGMIASKTDGFNASIKKIDTRRIEAERQLENVEARYRAQFSALDKIVSRLRNTSSFLTQQLDKLPGFSSE